MLQRITLLLVTLFWVTMNLLLWRSEFGGRNHVGNAVPLELVWRKMLTAPDNSALEILQHGRKIGYCRWIASVGQDTPTSRRRTPDAVPEGMVERFSSYRIDFEGNTMLGDLTNRLRFDFDLRLSTNQVWQEFDLRLFLRPDAWEIHSRAAEESVHFFTETEGIRSEQAFKFADLQNPETLAREFDLPALPGLLAGLGLPSGSGKPAPLSLGLRWEARNDWITIGHSSVRAYRVEARLLDHYRLVVIVSRVGEILRVELPDEIALVNDQLVNL